MTHLNDTMSTSLLTTHKKNAHLTKEERVMIATLIARTFQSRNWSPMDIYRKAFYQEISQLHQPIINWSVLFI
jgi:hypothetical protein